MWLKPFPGPCPAEHPKPGGGVVRASLRFLLELNGQWQLTSELLFGGYIRRVPGDPERPWCLSPVSSESPCRSCSSQGEASLVPPRRRRCVRRADAWGVGSQRFEAGLSSRGWHVKEDAPPGWWSVSGRALPAPRAPGAGVGGRGETRQEADGGK